MAKLRYVVVQLPLVGVPTMAWLHIEGETFKPFGFQKGYKDFWKKESFHHNPFHKVLDYRRSWYTGWMEGYKSEQKGNTQIDLLPISDWIKGANELSEATQSVGSAGLDGFLAPPVSSQGI